MGTVAAVVFAAILGFLLGGWSVTSIYLRMRSGRNLGGFLWGLITSLQVQGIRHLVLRETATGMLVTIAVADVADELRNRLVARAWAERLSSE